MTKPHKATPEHWAFLRRWATDGGNTATALVELRARVEALEAAHQPDKLDRLIALDRNDNDSLVERVAGAMGPSSQSAMDAGELPYGSACAAIREVADWIREEWPASGAQIAAAIHAAADQVVPEETTP